MADDEKKVKELPVSTQIIRFLEDHDEKGHTNPEIAQALGVTERSVRRNTWRLDWHGLIRGYFARNGNGRWTAHYKKRRAE